MEDEERFEVSKKLLKTLTVDTRTDILKSLENRPMTASELSRQLNKHVTTVSEHLDILNKSNLIERVERPGRKWVYYKLTKPGQRILHPESYRWAFIFVVTILSFVGVWYFISIKTYPGHWLYPIIGTGEKFQTMLTTDNVQKASLHIERAEEILEDTKTAVEKGQTGIVKEMMENYENEISQARNEIEIAKENNQNVIPVLEKLSESTAKQTVILQNLATKSPEIKQEVQPALNISEESHTAAVSQLVNITGKSYGQ
jgi:DNA-binding transcriptional ArsR family regulator